MADTSIKITLDLVDSTAQKALSNFIANTAKADDGLSKLKNSSDNTFNQISVGIGKSIGAFEIFQGNLAANIAIKAFDTLAEAAKGLFDTFIVDGIKAASDQQTAINQLNQALASAGQYTGEASEGFIKFAEGLEKTTTFSTTAIVKNAALLESLGHLNKEGLERGTQAALNLSAALGKDLESSVRALGRAANGNITALTKLGVVIEKGQTNAETFQNALEAVEARFGGAAQAQINTYSGAVAQAGNAFEALQISIGDAIVKNPVLIEIIKSVTSIIGEMTGSVNNNSESLKLFVGQGISGVITAAQVMVNILDGVIRTFQAIYGVTQALTTPFIALITIAKSFTEGFDKASQEFTQFTQNMAKNLDAFGVGGNGALAKVSGALGQMNDAADRGFKALKAGADGSVAPINGTAVAIKELTEEQKRAQAVLRSFADALVKQTTDQKLAYQSQADQAKRTAEIEIVQLEEQVQKNLLSYSDFEKKRNAIEASGESQRKTLADKQFAEENIKLKQAYDLQLSSKNEYYAAVTQLDINYHNEEQKAALEYAKKQADQDKKDAAAEQKIKEQKIQAVADTFTELSTLTSTKNRELFEIGKAASIAAATINTYEAITKTMASVPYPFNIPLAVAQGIAGAVQVANIVSTSPSFEAGGIVPGNSFSGDNIVANVNSGEMILNRSQQAQLFAQANGHGGGSDIGAKLDTLIGIMASKDDKVTVNVGGKTVVDTLRSELRAGRSFS